MNSSRLFYSREFMNSLRISILRYNSKVNLSKFSHYNRNRSKRIIAKITGRHRKHRADWQNALKRRGVSNLLVPVFISSNIQSLVSKSSDLCYLVHSNEYQKSSGVILLQETWLHQDIDDCVINIDGFSTFRVDRNVNFRNRSGGVLTYVNQTWCKSAEKIFTFNNVHISCLSIHCKPTSGTSNSCILKLMPKIYGHLGHIALTKDRHVRVRRRNCDTSAIISLQHMLNSTDFDIINNPDLSLHVETLSSYLNFILEICSPFETINIRTDFFLLQR